MLLFQYADLVKYSNIEKFIFIVVFEEQDPQFFICFLKKERYFDNILVYSDILIDYYLHFIFSSI